MKSKKTFYLGCLILFTLILSSFSVVTIHCTTRQFYPHISSVNFGISNYRITQSVKYQVEINFSLIQKSGITHYIFKFARLDNRVPNSTFTRYTPPYQENELLYSDLIGCRPSDINTGHLDKFNNTFDSFNATLSPLNIILSKLKQKITFNQKYMIQLNAIEFQDIEESDIGSYDTTNEIFELYCDQSEPYYERDSPSLIELSNRIVNPDDNPIEKVKKIISWIAYNIDYNEICPLRKRVLYGLIIIWKVIVVNILV